VSGGQGGGICRMCGEFEVVQVQERYAWQDGNRGFLSRSADESREEDAEMMLVGVWGSWTLLRIS
jgi:hypothetical protein